MDKLATVLRERDPLLAGAAALDATRERLDEELETHAGLQGTQARVDAAVDVAVDRVLEERVTQKVAARLSDFGTYLQDADYGRLTSDLGALVAERPAAAIGLAVGAGFVLGATLGRGRALRFAVPTLITPLLAKQWRSMSDPGTESKHDRELVA